MSASSNARSSLKLERRCGQPVAPRTAQMMVAPSPPSEATGTCSVSGLDNIEACYVRLKELVPSVTLDTPLSSVQLLQHVIDYIVDLELTLNSPSTNSKPAIDDSLTTVTRTYSESLTNVVYSMTSRSTDGSETNRSVIRDCRRTGDTLRPFE